MPWSLSRAELPARLVEDLRGRPVDPEQGWRQPQGSGVAGAPRLDGDSWLARLPRTVAEAMERWELARDHDAPLRAGSAALVVPVRRPRGDVGALKVGWPHPEADTEHLALRAWRGEGAVRLLAADPASSTLLLERLDAERDLTSGTVLATTEALGALVRRLDRPAPPWAPSLHTQLVRIGEQLDRFGTDGEAARTFPRRMVQQAAAIVRELRSDDRGPGGAGTATSGGPAGRADARLVHTDLHQSNVLWRPDPGEWVAIDPKPLAGDPHWVVAPALWNRWDDVLAAPDARAHLRLRLGILCDAAGLDEDRARAMTIVRMVHTVVSAAGAGQAEEWAGRAVTIVKAAQPG